MVVHDGSFALERLTASHMDFDTRAPLVSPTGHGVNDAVRRLRGGLQVFAPSANSKKVYPTSPLTRWLDQSTSLWSERTFLLLPSFIDIEALCHTAANHPPCLYGVLLWSGWNRCLRGFRLDAHSIELLRMTRNALCVPLFSHTRTSKLLVQPEPVWH